MRTLLFCAVATLVVNDVVRLCLPSIQQGAVAYLFNNEESQDENPVNPFSLLEEEVKHHYEKLRVHPFELNCIVEAKDEATLPITDDDLQLFAFIPIFSPPPNRA
ncbi:MAG: hypothetical protein IT270_04425 [Saprospiraceae bacterium]|nr:hypothetical protein [Saprospiraceae bacterium]